MKQAMIFAAGLGTRLRPLTDHKPKALVEVNGRPLLGHLLDRLRAAGFERVVINVHHFGQQIIDYVESYQHTLGAADVHPSSATPIAPMQLLISDERDLLLDTGGGLRRALPLLDPTSPVLVHNVDIASDLDLQAFYAAHIEAAAHDGRAATLGVNRRQTSRYLLFDDTRLCGWTNISTGQVKSPYAAFDATDTERYAFMGIHVVDPRLYPLLSERPVEPFSIVDFYLSVADRCPIMAAPAAEGLRWIDCGKPETLTRAAEIL